MGNTMCGEHSCVCWKLEEEGRGFLQQKNRPKSSFLIWLIGFSFGLWMLCLYSNEVVSRGTSRNRCGERIKTLSIKDVQNVRNWTELLWVLLRLVSSCHLEPVCLLHVRGSEDGNSHFSAFRMCQWSTRCWRCPRTTWSSVLAAACPCPPSGELHQAGTAVLDQPALWAGRVSVRDVLCPTPSVIEQ